MHDALTKFIQAKPENLDYIEEKILANLTNQNKILARYITAIFVMTLGYYIIDDSTKLSFNFLGVSISQLDVVEFAIPLTLTFLLIFYLKALSFKKDLESCYRYVFAANHNLAFSGDLYKPHYNDKLTRLILPFATISEMFISEGSKLKRTINFIVSGIPTLLFLFLPVNVITEEINAISAIENKSVKEYFLLSVLYLGMGAGAVFFVEYEAKLIAVFRRRIHIQDAEPITESFPKQTPPHNLANVRKNVDFGYVRRNNTSKLRSRRRRPRKARKAGRTRLHAR